MADRQHRVMTRILKTIKGFTLLEISVVLTVIALAAGGVLSVAAGNVEEKRQEITEERMEKIMQAIEQYAEEFDHLPCPADNSLDPEDADFGNGAGTNTTPGDCTTSAAGANKVVTAGVDVAYGGVPYQQLNIPPEWILDGWSNRFTYVVDEDVTYPGPNVDAGDQEGYLNEHPDMTADIDIQDEDDISFFDSDGAAVLLISHGRNGNYAWRAKGGGQNGSGGTYEEDNDPFSDQNEIFRIIPHRLKDSGGLEDPFDDILEYRTLWKLRQ